jgi:hypothetical protein
MPIIKTNKQNISTILLEEFAEPEDCFFLDNGDITLKRIS